MKQKNKKIVFNKKYSLKQLREIFNMEQTGGSKIQQQLKEIEKKYKLTKVKRGIYMIERELTDDEKIENQNYNKNRTYIEPMIYELLGNLKKNFIIMDMHELMEEIEIVNKDFNYIKWHTKNVAKAINQNEDTLKIFTKESEPMLKKIIRDVLYDMADACLIDIEEIPVLAYKIYDIDNQYYYTKTKVITSNKDKQELLNIKNKVLHMVKLSKESELNYYQRGYFRDLIAKEYDASYFYYRYKLILNTNGIKKELEQPKYDINKLKKKFNAHIQDKLSKSKQGKMKVLTKEERKVYIKYCIDTNQDFNLRKIK